MNKEDREYTINRLLNCVIPVRFASYPKKWYEKLSDSQLIRMCEEIYVDGPTVEDYIDEENLMLSRNLSADEKERYELEQAYPTFPYRFNTETSEFEVFTESKIWEVVCE